MMEYLADSLHLAPYQPRTINYEMTLFHEFSWTLSEGRVEAMEETLLAKG